MDEAVDSIRLFVSSTFLDMNAERDHLNRFIFPELREYCLARGVEFIGVDLRWGLTEDDAGPTGAGSLSLCLKEIERCRPFFICLLGERYGWVVPPETIEKDFFERVLSNGKISDQNRTAIRNCYQPACESDGTAYRLIRTHDKPPGLFRQLAYFWEYYGLEGAFQSITALEILRAAFERGYPETHCFFYLRKPGFENEADFPPDWRPSFIENDPSAAKELKALKRRIVEAKETLGVRAYRVGYRGRRVDSSFVPRGLSRDERLKFADGLIRPDDWPALSPEMQRIIKERGTIALNGMAGLGKQIVKDLTGAIDTWLEGRRQTAGWKAYPTGKALIAQDESFIRERTRIFVGREDILGLMSDYVADADNREPLVFTGRPGCGKSTALAEFVRRSHESLPGETLLKKGCPPDPFPKTFGTLGGSDHQSVSSRAGNPDAHRNRPAVVAEFIGATAGSTDLSTMLRRVLTELKRECGLPDEIPDDPRLLRNLLPDFLAKAAKTRPVVLILDAVNQLDPGDRVHELDWLPFRLPDGVKLIVSALEGECLDQLKARIASKNIRTIGPLSVAERECLVAEHLAERGKKLTEENLAAFLNTKGRPDADLPLYLMVAVEELCLFAAHYHLLERIKHFPPDLPALFQQVLHRLEFDFGLDFTRTTLRWLAASRAGLTELEVLELHRRYRKDPGEKWKQFYRSLRVYLRPMDEGETAAGEATGLIGFFHDQIRYAVYRRYFGMKTPDSAATDACRRTHKELADYFEAIARDKPAPACPGPRSRNPDPVKWTTDRPRGLSELPFHQIGQEAWDALAETLCDLRFIEAKIAAGMTFPLIGDYAATLDALPEGREEMEKKRAHQLRVKKYVAVLIAAARSKISRPEIIPSVKPWTEEEIEKDSERIRNNPTRLDRIRAFSQFVNSEAHALAKATGTPLSCVQHAYNFADSGPVASAAEKIVETETRFRLLLKQAGTRSSYNPHPALLKTMDGHTDRVRAVSVTPDGLRAVSGSTDRALRLWDLETGRCLKIMEGHANDINAVSVTIDGLRAVSGSDDHTVRLWDLETGTCIRTMKGPMRPVTAVSVTADGLRAVSGGSDRALRLWDLETGRCLKIIEGHTNDVTAVIITADGLRAVSGGRDGTVRFWDLETCRCLSTKVERVAITGVSVTPDGLRAVSGGGAGGRPGDCLVRVWHLKTETCLKTMGGHSDMITGVSVTPDGLRAVSASCDRTLRLWDLETGTCLKTMEGHTNDVTAVSVTPDGLRAVSGSDDYSVRLWDLETGMCLKTTAGHTRDVCVVTVTLDGLRAVSGGDDHEVRFWDLESGRCLSTYSGGHRDNVRAVSVTPDGLRAVSGGDEGYVCLWNLETYILLKVMEGHTARVRTVGVAPDGLRAVSAGGNTGRRTDSTIRLWDLETATCLKTMNGHTAEVHTVGVTPDGLRAISGSSDNMVRLWDLETGKCLKTMEGHTGMVNAVSVTPDGLRAVSGSEDCTVRLWDLETGTCLKTMAEHEDLVRAVSVTLDGLRAVSGSWDGMLRLWDFETGRCLRTMKGHTDLVRAVSVTPDNLRALSGSRDGTVRLWDLETGECLAAYHARGGVQAVSAVAAADRIVGGTAAGEVLILAPRNVSCGPPVVTGVRLRLGSTERRPGIWDAQITAVCPWCGKRASVAPDVLDVIRGIARNAGLVASQPRFPGLPREAWSQPRLLSACPECGKPLKFNPFVVDNRP